MTFNININNRRKIKLYYNDFYYYIGKKHTTQNIYLATCILDALFINYKKAIEYSNIHLIFEISKNINKIVYFIIRSYKKAIKDKMIYSINRNTFKKKITVLKNKISECDKLTNIHFENVASFATFIESGRIKFNEVYTIIDDIIKILNSL